MRFMPALLISPSAADRRARALEWLGARRAGSSALIVGASMEAAADLVREAARERPAGFGWQRLTTGRLAATLAAPLLAERGLAQVTALSFEALCARAVDALHKRGALGRLATVADRPGLPRALARTVSELRLAGASAAALPEGLGAALQEVEAELARARLADRALVLRLAAAALGDGADRPALASFPALLLDVPITCALERDLFLALARHGADLLATLPAGDERSRRHLERALGVKAEVQRASSARGSLGRVQEQLFSTADAEQQPLGAEVVILSAPGEGRECVELARLILREAAKGTPFDRMAVLLRSPTQHRALLEEALGRAGIPAHFARGTSRPDPTGRAFLALLACRAQGLSAVRFGEYLSLGEVPDADAQGAPPPAPPAGDRFAPAEAGGEGDANLGERSSLHEPEPEAAQEPAADPDVAPVRSGSLRAPAHWEKLLVEAAVIGSRERWRKRLAGLEHDKDLRLAEYEREDDPKAGFVKRELCDLAALRDFALPLIDELAALPESALWADWLEALTALATRSLKDPVRVLSLLTSLAPLGPVGPVRLSEVRQVLEKRLCDLAVPPAANRYGKLFVAPIEAARGLSFEVVFAPGLAEKLFPPRLAQDPLLRDREREALGGELQTNKDRLEHERLLLRLVAGAASKRLVLSYPRLDAQQGRPRVPSFYGLEVMRAATGVLPGYGELARQAEQAAAARAGWPAPKEPRDAIDEAEHDLSLLHLVVRLPDAEAKGTARYLLGVNPHLSRALKARGRRQRKRWLPTDGLVDPKPPALVQLGKHALSARLYSATALQNYAACPYRFLLQVIHKLSPREEPERIDQIDPLQRGSLMHDTQFELLSALAAEGGLPLDAGTLPAAQQRLEAVLGEVSKRFEEKLYPAIPRVWEDGVASVRADLRGWLARLAADTRAFAPLHFELSFGMPERLHRDPASRTEPVVLDNGIRLKGSIDLVERRQDGHLRATDYKSGKKRAAKGTVIGGGATLQPVLYALALEKLFPGQPVDEGRLWYCTYTGEFEEVPVPLDTQARESLALLASAVGEALDTGFLPVAPRARECEWCDYQSVCGPHEEQRASRKPQDRLQRLNALRELP